MGELQRERLLACAHLADEDGVGGYGDTVTAQVTRTQSRAGGVGRQLAQEAPMAFTDALARVSDLAETRRLLLARRLTAAQANVR